VKNLVRFVEHPDRDSASDAAAGILAGAIRSSLKQAAHSSLVVSGGTTPGPCFDRLSRENLDWNRVTVIPSDERWVPPDHADSNERLIRERLLRHQATAAQVLPLFRPDIESTLAPSLIHIDLQGLLTHLAGALLGMGEDGHFASLFPDFEGLESALDPENDTHCMLVKTASSPHLRISLSLAALLRANCLVLLIFGQAKRQVFQAAATGDRRYPIARLLKHVRSPITVAWAP
jgi:6-phosphogluconolactonase